MIAFFGPILLLILLFALAFVLVEKWTQLKGQIIARLIVITVIVGVGTYGLWHWVSVGVSCLPDCVGANLVGREMSGGRFINANFVDANLNRANLSRSRLQGADFSGALLVRANFEGADLRNAKFYGASLQRANLAGANLSGAIFDGADLTEADLTGLDLTETSLLGVIMEGAEMESVDLTGAVLTAIDLVDAKLNGARMINTDLTGATLSRADLSGAQLSGSNLSGAWLNLAMLIGADLTNVDLSGASMIGADLASANFGSSRMVGATLVGADMNGANLNGVNLLGARLQLSELTDADLVLDGSVAELNELQRSLLLVDTTYEGATFDSQTVWPNVAVDEEMASTIELIEDSGVILTDTIKVGVLHSLSGPIAISEIAARDATFLAIDEINESGGVLGKQLEPIIEDGASTPEVFAEKARKLLAEDEVAVVFGGWRNDTRNAMIPIFEELNGLLFYPASTEGFQQSPNAVFMGQDASQQLIPAVNYLLEQGLVNILLIGSEFNYSRAAHLMIQVQVREMGYAVVGELLVPLGETQFGSLMEQLRASPPDVIINTMYGESNVAFFQQLAEAGFTPNSLPVLSTSVAEEEIRVIGAEYVAGHLVTGNYFQTLQSPENFGFVTAYKETYGQERVTSSSIAAAYAGVYTWRELVENAQSTDIEDVRAAMAEPIDYISPGGPIILDPETQYTFKFSRIGTVREDGLIDELVGSADLLPPDPFLGSYSWGDEVAELLQEEAEPVEE